MAEGLSHGKTGDIFFFIAHCTFAFLGVVVTRLLLKLRAVIRDDTLRLSKGLKRGL